MWDSLVLKKINNYFELIRFNKPIGYMLLVWPCWFALALLDKDIDTLLTWFFIFFVGSFLMRSAGCIINDLVDINLDLKVKRTKTRPLPSKKVSMIEALLILIILLILSLYILTGFNWPSIISGLIVFPLIIIYPFMKRITYWPQLFLGIIFNWGIIIVSMQFYEKITLNFSILYIGAIFWTIAYDTIYAYQDKTDDLKSGIKSTAIYFGQKGQIFVFLCYLVFLATIGYLGWSTTKSFLSIIIIATISICTYIAVKKWDMNSVNNSNYYFRLNNLFAFILFLYLLIF